MVLSFWDSIKDFFEEIKDFFIENSRNPFLWVGIILVALLIFEYTYNSLHKN